MSPNPNRDPETQQFTSPPPESPAPEGPDWGSLGVDFETAQNYVNMGRSLENLSTRRQALESIYDPRYDGEYLAPVEQAEQRPPWEQEYEQPEEPEYYQHEQPASPYIPPDQIAAYVEQQVMGKLSQMAQQGAIEDAAGQAIAAAGLPDDPMVRSAILGQTQQIVGQYANRQPGEVANEVARAFKAKMDDFYRQTMGAPSGDAPAPPPAGAPTPGEQRPRTMEEAMEWSMRNLDPSP